MADFVARSTESQLELHVMNNGAAYACDSPSVLEYGGPKPKPKKKPRVHFSDESDPEMPVLLTSRSIDELSPNAKALRELYRVQLRAGRLRHAIRIKRSLLKTRLRGIQILKGNKMARSYMSKPAKRGYSAPLGESVLALNWDVAALDLPMDDDGFELAVSWF